jgi:hypothetical protein
VFVPEDMERAVEPLSEDDAGARWRQGSLRSQELYELGVKGDSPVVVDLPCILEAEDVVEIDAKSRSVDVGEALGVSEASVVVVNEEGLE